MTLTWFQVHATLAAAGIPAAVIFERDDAVYRPCQSSWLLGDYSRWWRTKAAPALGMDVYAEESGDCDDSVDCHNALARWAHRRMQESKGFAFPIGRLNFSLVPDAPMGPLRKRHACAWAITADRGLIFPEPQQLYGELRLTVPQLNSATRCD